MPSACEKPCTTSQPLYLTILPPEFTLYWKTQWLATIFACSGGSTNFQVPRDLCCAISHFSTSSYLGQSRCGLASWIVSGSSLMVCEAATIANSKCGTEGSVPVVFIFAVAKCYVHDICLWVCKGCDLTGGLHSLWVSWVTGAACAQAVASGNVTNVGAGLTGLCCLWPQPSGLGSVASVPLSKFLRGLLGATFHTGLGVGAGGRDITGEFLSLQGVSAVQGGCRLGYVILSLSLHIPGN